jgi:prepilin-type N-terminal cleavage/methylation domain-containing protein
MQGFSLIEMLLALLILTYGLLGVGQLIFASLGSSALARSKETASFAAKNKLESLAYLHRLDPGAPDLANGSHGPEQAQIVNPLNGKTLNRYDISWVVSPVPDPRVGMALPAKTITVTATPINAAGAINKQILLNKVVIISSVISGRLE